MQFDAKLPVPVSEKGKVESYYRKHLQQNLAFGLKTGVDGLQCGVVNGQKG